MAHLWQIFWLFALIFTFFVFHHHSFLNQGLVQDIEPWYSFKMCSHILHNVHVLLIVDTWEIQSVFIISIYFQIMTNSMKSIRAHSAKIRTRFNDEWLLIIWVITWFSSGIMLINFLIQCVYFPFVSLFKFYSFAFYSFSCNVGYFYINLLSIRQFLFLAFIFWFYDFSFYSLTY
jgi:hypothetical protein